MTEKEYQLKENSGMFDETQIALFDIARQLTIGNEHLKRVADALQKKTPTQQQGGGYR